MFCEIIMTDFVIVCTSNLEASYSAYNFSKAIINSTGSNQHHLKSIFFYLDGSQCANSLLDLPGDEPNLQQLWRQLSEQHQLELIVCSSSALRRGIGKNNLAAGFKFGSLAQLMLACNAADKVVQL